MTDRYIAKVAAIVDEATVVINRGAGDGISDSGILRIVRLGTEIFDPDSGQSLGPMEVLVGRVEVLHLEDNKATVTTFGPPAPPPERVGLLSLSAFSLPARIVKPMLNAKVGDLVIRE